MGLYGHHDVRPARTGFAWFLESWDAIQGCFLQGNELPPLPYTVVEAAIQKEAASFSLGARTEAPFAIQGSAPFTGSSLILAKN